MCVSDCHCHAEMLKQRAQLHALFVVANHDHEEVWGLIDSLLLSDMTTQAVWENWSRGRSGTIEVELDASSFAESTDATSLLMVVYREVMDLMVAKCGENPEPESDWGERWLEVMSPDELEMLGRP